jgi:hypothetical protein
MNDHTAVVSEQIAQGGPGGFDNWSDGVGIVEGGNANGDVS